MMLHLDLETHMTQDDILGFLKGNAEGTVLVPDRKEAYEHVTRVLRRFSYWRLGKPDKGLLLRYLRRTTGLSRAQLTRLVGRYLAAGGLGDGRRGAGKRFRCRYGPEDILLLAETDELHGTLSGSATLVLLKRAWEVFGDSRFERLAGLPNGHLYNLRRSTGYVRRMGRKEVTRSAQVTIVERRRPRPEGLPGYLRVDSVHQGDLDKVKGVHHIDVVETFCATPRFQETCYRAATWLRLGQTQGRGELDTRHEYNQPVKNVFVKPLCPDWKAILNR